MKRSRSLLKFAVTGIGATVIHVLVVSVLVPHLNVNVGLSNGIAFTIATAFSNFVNTHWSFQAQFTRQTVLRFWWLLSLAVGSQ